MPKHTSNDLQQMEYKRGEKVIRDRGNIKWNAMMLPEHVKVLREWREKDKYEEKPTLDEGALQDLNEQSSHCLHQSL